MPPTIGRTHLITQLLLFALALVAELLILMVRLLLQTQLKKLHLEDTPDVTHSLKAEARHSDKLQNEFMEAQRSGSIWLI